MQAYTTTRVAHGGRASGRQVPHRPYATLHRTAPAALPAGHPRPCPPPFPPAALLLACASSFATLIHLLLPSPAPRFPLNCWLAGRLGGGARVRAGGCARGAGLCDGRQPQQQLRLAPVGPPAQGEHCRPGHLQVLAAPEGGLRIVCVCLCPACRTRAHALPCSRLAWPFGTQFVRCALCRTCWCPCVAASWCLAP